MNLSALLSAAVLLAPNPDPGPPPKDCAQFVMHYRALIEHQSALDSEVARPADGAAALAQVGRARLEGARAADYVDADLMRACREANGSQYECVVTADSYDELNACHLQALPVLDPGDRAVAAETATMQESDTKEERAIEPVQVTSEYVQRGTIDLEALGTGSAAPEVQPQPPAAASEGR